MIDKIRPQDIDKIITAELPDPNTDPELFRIVSTTMIHGPCGHINPNSPCMKDGRCTKHYPREFLRATVTARDGYPLYRRRSPEEGGVSVTINGKQIDNRWVVPHNPFLCRTFDAHANVEYCATVKAIKYVCEYINKGKDKAVVALQRKYRNDEITRFQVARYICTSEALWRIFQFPIQDHDPTVQHLQVHLKNGQRVYFTPENAEDLAAQPPKTTLTEFFQLCSTDDFAKTLLYSQIPKYYTWTNKQWKRRIQGTPLPERPEIRQSSALGRVYAVHPRNAECYYLRLLLHVVRGPTSFADLKTVNGVLLPTYREACKELGLLEHDDHWHRALQEAATTDRPYKIRDMFAIMLHMCQISDPLALWNAHKQSMAEDYLHAQRRLASNNTLPFSQAIFNRALIYIEDKLLTFPGGLPLKDYGLPAPERENANTNHSSREIAAEFAYDVDLLRSTVTRDETTLTEDQHRAYDAILHSIESPEASVIFLDAPGGTGKTYLINLILAKVRSHGHVALAVASSGIAATLLTGGKTAHSVFKLPLNITRYENPSCQIGKNTDRAALLRLAKVVVWDECTMSNKRAFEAVDRTLRDIRGDDRLMGGLSFILAGDFRQTLPIVPKGTKADEIQACLKSSAKLWPHVTTLRFRTNMRVHLFGDSDSGAYSNLLLDIGSGTIATDPTDGLIEIPCGQHLSSLHDLMSAVFPDLSTKYSDTKWLCERAILAPTNKAVNEINDTLLTHIPTRQIVYTSFDTTVDADDAVNFPVELLNSLNPPGLPPHYLQLKLGSPVMLLRNIDAPKLCNGTKLTVKQLLPNIIEATISQGHYAGETVYIPRIPLIPSDTTVPFKRLQFPLKLAFAMTINKSQGQTIKVVGLSLLTRCFSHGQFYVACSRVSSPRNLYILSETQKTANVVYTEIL